MKSFPSFDEKLPSLNQFVIDLVAAYQAKQITDWAELNQRVKRFYTTKEKAAMEHLVPGWAKMASYAQGITQTHVICVFLGVYMLPEFEKLTQDEQQAIKWIILFHDLDKFHIKGKKDSMHAFNSAILAARLLPRFDFEITSNYPNLIENWSDFTRNAYIKTLRKSSPTPDNKKLSEILGGIDKLFGENTPASLIAKVVLLHISINIDPFYPTPAPLTGNEIQEFISPKLFSLLKLMMLGDIEGWSLFQPESRKQQRSDAYNVFEKVDKLIQNCQL